MLAELSLRHSSVILVVFKVTVLLEDNPSAPALSSLDLFFLKKKKSSISFQRFRNTDQCLCPICRKTPPQHHAAISVRHCRVEQVMNGACFSPNVMLSDKAKNVILAPFFTVF